jgi:hypothetical protein
MMNVSIIINVNASSLYANITTTTNHQPLAYYYRSLINNLQTVTNHLQTIHFCNDFMVWVDYPNWYY